jgi:hypothetical protein
MKFKLVIFIEDVLNNLLAAKFKYVMAENFDIESFDNQKIYDKSSTVFYLTCGHFNKIKPIIENIVDSGYKVVIENLWEGGFGVGAFPTGSNVLTITAGTPGNSKVHVPMFFWYNPNRPYLSPEYIIDYKAMIREHKFDKKFLMLMRGLRKFRDQIYTKFGDILDDSYYSYYERGIKIFGDKEVTPEFHITYGDYVNVEWYNRTQFSVVVETSMNSNRPFLTEKTTRPLAIKHPFIILGDTGTLALLRSSGFETFENIFDESYDLITNQSNRIDAVYTQVKDYNQSEYSKLTKDKIEHNYNLYHNDAEVNCRFKREIIDPILEFVNG